MHLILLNKNTQNILYVAKTSLVKTCETKKLNVLPPTGAMM